MSDHDRDPPSLGDLIRRQRELSEMTVRQFADLAGISNPYLSQIERGLREPSERVLESIASVLHTSADALYDEAGLGRAEGGVPPVVAAIESDPDLSPSQRRALIQTYEAFVGGRRRPARRSRP